MIYYPSCRGRPPLAAASTACHGLRRVIMSLVNFMRPSLYFAFVDQMEKKNREHTIHKLTLGFRIPRSR